VGSNKQDIWVLSLASEVGKIKQVIKRKLSAFLMKKGGESSRGERPYWVAKKLEGQRYEETRRGGQIKPP